MYCKRNNIIEQIIQKKEKKKGERKKRQKEILPGMDLVDFASTYA
jgi:hypothetical protein